MAKVIFNYEGINFEIPCNLNEKMKDIIKKFLIQIKCTTNNLLYLYAGNMINYEFAFNEQANDLDKNRKKMNVLVKKVEVNNNTPKEIISKDIICPKCKKNILLDFDNFKINFHECKKNHNINNISLTEFEETQKINLNNIICNICDTNNKGNTYNNKFYICCTCNKNICPLCKGIHDKNHIIINYDDKNYICSKHNEPFIKYCSTHKKDICILCDVEHINDKTIEFTKIFIQNNDLLKSVEDLNNSIDNLKYKIYIIKDIFDRLLNTMEQYFIISKTIINNYNANKRNYYILQNLTNLKNNNENIIKYIFIIKLYNKIKQILLK